MYTDDASNWHCNHLVIDTHWNRYGGTYSSLCSGTGKVMNNVSNDLTVIQQHYCIVLPPDK